MTVTPDFVLLLVLGLYIVLSEKKKSWSALKFLNLEPKIQKGRQVIFLVLSDVLVFLMIFLDVNLMTLFLGFFFLLKSLFWQKAMNRLFKVSWFLLLGSIIFFVFLQFSNLWDLSDYSIASAELLRLNSMADADGLAKVLNEPFNDFILGHTLKAYLEANPSLRSEYQDLMGASPEE